MRSWEARDGTERRNLPDSSGTFESKSDARVSSHGVTDEVDLFEVQRVDDALDNVHVCPMEVAFSVLELSAEPVPRSIESDRLHPGELGHKRGEKCSERRSTVNKYNRLAIISRSTFDDVGPDWRHLEINESRRRGETNLIEEILLGRFEPS